MMVKPRWVVLWAVLGLVVGAVLAYLRFRPVQLASNAPPWWGTPSFTLAGGVAGALLGGYFTMRNESNKRLDSREVARHDEEWASSIEFGKKAKAYFDDVHDQVEDATDEGMSGAYTSLGFCAAPDVVSAAEAVVFAALNFHKEMAATIKDEDVDPYKHPLVNEAVRWFHLMMTDYNNVLRTIYKRPLIKRSETPVAKPLQVTAWEKDKASGAPG